MKFKNILFTYLLIVFTLLFSASNVSGQHTAPENYFYLKALDNAMSVYHQSFGNHSALFN